MTPEEENICRVYVEAWKREWEALEPNNTELKDWDEWPEAGKAAQWRCLQIVIAKCHARVAELEQAIREMADADMAASIAEQQPKELFP